ncbi:MAG TPA: cupin domain-containing protein [Mucilaginibacter sp.]|nr:cupin domain-containing protein [Mucilaginibacter sp.]
MFPFFKETIRVGALELNFLMDGKDTDGTLVQFEMVVPVGARVPAPHYHVNVDETIYMLDGIVTQRVGDQILELKPGDTCFIKRGVIHGFESKHNQPARALVTLSPASIGPDYFREVADVLNAGGPPDMQKILSIMKSHGLEPVKPD